MSSFLCVLKDLHQNIIDSGQHQQSQSVYDYIEDQIKHKINQQNQFYNKQPCYVDPRYHYIEYVPFKRKVIQYQDVEYRQRIPIKRKQLYQVNRFILEQVPHERVSTDYYAVQHIRYYKKQIIPQKSIQYVPVLRTIKKLQYIPVERKIVHYPKYIGNQTTNEWIRRDVSNQISQVSVRNSLNDREYSVNRSFIGSKQEYQQMNQKDKNMIEDNLENFSPIKRYSMTENDVVKDGLQKSILISLKQAAYEVKQ